MMHAHHSHETHTGGPAITSGRLIHWAHWYDSFVNVMTLGGAARLRQASLELARLVPGESVLDIGCGSADLTLLAAAQVGRAGRVVGIDPAPEMIEVARSKAARQASHAEFFVQPAEHIACADASFDVALSSLMMHHLPDHLKQEVLIELRRVLKPGGRLIIIDIRRPETGAGRLMNGLFLHGALKVGVQDLTIMLTQAGFVIEEIGSLPQSILGFIRAGLPN